MNVHFINQIFFDLIENLSIIMLYLGIPVFEIALFMCEEMRKKPETFDSTRYAFLREILFQLGKFFGEVDSSLMMELTIDDTLPDRHPNTPKKGVFQR